MQDNTIEPTDLKALGKELISESTDAVATHIHSDHCGCHNESTSTEKTQAFKKNLSDIQAELNQNISMHGLNARYKDEKALKRSRYHEESNKFRFAYVLQNQRTGVIVELKAASSFHACNMIGWKPNRVKLIEVIDTQKNKETQEVVDVVEVIEKK